MNNNGQATRRGGDEFVAILLETDREGAEVVARRIGEQVTLAVNQRLPLVREKLRRPFTVTIGMAQYHPDIDADENALLDRANQDLTLKRTARGESRRS
ncbi:diguanylate cyclase [Candidatus Daviesbacteria bacterium]|nr:diguanylate cyclase [Candidatus Daviesbacteria bacterium]